MKRDHHESEVDQQLETFKKDLMAKAIKLFEEAMPAKVLALAALFEHDMFQRTNEQVAAAGATAYPKETEGERKKRKVDAHAPPVPCNALVLSVSEVVKKEMSEFVDIISTLKVFTQLLIPKIEDGNNFGVSVQEDVLQELTRAEETAFNYLDQFSKYYLNRAKLQSKIAKYPFIQDYVQCAAESDMKTYTNYRYGIYDLRNHYLLLHDLLQKNWEKLLLPRGEGESTGLMY